MRHPARLATALLAPLLALAAPARAHSPFLQPLNFAPSRDTVTVIGGMHEEQAFLADFAIRPGDLFVIGPDGVRTKLEGQATLKGLTAVDVPLPAPGTYRVTTGPRPGREATMAQVDGVWRMVRPAPQPGAAGGPPRTGGGGEGPPAIDPSAVPAGAPVVKTSSTMEAQTYVTRGKPTPGALKAAGQGFEIEPVTHPNEAYLDTGFRFRLLIDGRPAAGVPVLVRRGDEAYAETKTEITLKTGADGAALLKPPKPGAYILETAYPAPAAEGAAPSARSYRLTLSVEVTP